VLLLSSLCRAAATLVSLNTTYVDAEHRRSADKRGHGITEDMSADENGSGAIVVIRSVGEQDALTY
jgi:hypothetical protein